MDDSLINFELFAFNNSLKEFGKNFIVTESMKHKVDQQKHSKFCLKSESVER